MSETAARLATRCLYVNLVIVVFSASGRQNNSGESGAKRRHCRVRSWELESWEIRIGSERESRV